jgi:uncharacterized protein
MRQVLVIHGGDTFETREEYLAFLRDFPVDLDDARPGSHSWKGALPEELGDGYDVIAPSMPNKGNAKYSEWKIWFEKFLPLLDDEIIFVGHSLGGTFLAKYLAENKVRHHVLGTFLVAPCFDDADADYSMADFVLPADLSKLQEQAGKLFFYHSSDDPVVPFTDLAKFEAKLPDATYRRFADRGHFNQNSFPEIVEDIRGLK